MLDRAGRWARALKTDAVAVFLAARDPRTPLSAKILAMAVAAYAFSPIDLIPDFIPVLGYLDDLIIVPLGIVLVIKLVPPHLMAEFRATAATCGPVKKNRLAGALIIALWLIGAALLAAWAWRRFR